MMNIEQLKMLISSERPVELAYGYTMNRDNLHIILYDDKVSRIETDEYNNVLYREDDYDFILFDMLVSNHKRFYPNRVNAEFLDLINSFGLDIAITNLDADENPVLEFGEVIEKLDEKDIPKIYFKLNPTSSLMTLKAPKHYYFLNAESMFSNVYITADSRKNYESFEEDLMPISKNSYYDTKRDWNEVNIVKDIKVFPSWAIADEKGDIYSISSKFNEMINYRNQLYIEGSLTSRIDIQLAYGLENTKTKEKYQDYYLSHTEAFLNAYKEAYREVSKEDRYFIAINDKDSEAQWIYYHSKDNFESDTEIDLSNELVPEPTIRVKKENFKEIDMYEYMAIMAYDTYNDSNLRDFVINK